MQLLWLRNDLRLDDHQGLRRLAKSHDAVAAVFILPSCWLQPDSEGLHRLGVAKARYLQQALADMSRRLAPCPLYVLSGDPAALLLQWYRHSPFSLITHEAQAPEEAAWLEQLRHHGVGLTLFSAQTLFEPEQLQPVLTAFPASFSAFRKQVEATLALSVAPPVAAIELEQLTPAPCPLPGGMVWPQEQEGEQPHPALVGGESAATDWLRHYLFERQAIAHYKASRNQLHGHYYSSRLSAALAWGCLSVRRVWQQIDDYESQYGADEHSYWLRFELLWREYFHWSLRLHGRRVFAARGLTGRAPSGRHNSRYWQAWCRAQTGWPMIDAGLRELMTTGFCSNRLRQNLASCFIHELGLDWRLGARFFEQYLVDFDVASNWGNWAYIAGTGHDPRHGRRFNPHRQWRQYDPQLKHLHYWLPELGPVSLAQVESHQQGRNLLDYPAPLLPLES